MAIKASSQINFCFKLVLLCATLCVFVPFSPKMPAAGLDASWALALNQAVAQGLAFGKDIVFTLGPYSSIYTKAYHPATDFMMIAGSTYLALSFWICLLLLMKNIQWYWIVSLCMFLFTMVYARDSLFFSYPLLTGLACLKLGESAKSSRFFWLVLLFAPFGLLPLIKGSFLIISSVSAFFCSLFFFLINQRKESILCLVIPIVTLVFFWFCSGQQLSNLPFYVSSTFFLASGFSEAMSTQGNSGEILIYLVNSLAIFLFIFWQKQLKIKTVFLSGLFFIFLFISFKAGFTRHYGHAFIASTSILLAPIILALISNSNSLIALTLCSLGTCLMINNHYTHISLRHNLVSTYSTAWYGLTNRLDNKDWLTQNFALITHFLHEQVPFPPLAGTTDIYSYAQTYLISSPNTWSPRPIFQSYSVFTPRLAEENKRHLSGQFRPDNIIFRIEPIDGKLPSLEDGASWPLLLSYYRPASMINNFLLLKKENIQLIEMTNSKASKHYVLGERVNLPIHEKPLFVKIEIKPTLWGNLASIFFKPSQLKASFTLKNGSEVQYRLSANMAKSEFLLSPLIENTLEFASLFNKTNDLDSKQVISFIVQAEEGIIAHWASDYVLRFSNFPASINE